MAVSSRVHHVVALALIVCCGACSRPGSEKMQAPIAHDPSSYANISAFVTTHLVIDLTADFGARVMSGQVSLSFERRDPSATELVLDTRDLTISRTEAAIGSAAWVETPFKLDAQCTAFGSALRIVMPPGADRARVTYMTSPGAKGLQW